MDTGVPKSLIGAYGTSPEAVFQMDEEDHLVRQVARIGVTPEDVHYLVCMRYDFDHAGNYEDSWPPSWWCSAPTTRRRVSRGSRRRAHPGTRLVSDWWTATQSCCLGSS